MGLHADYSYEHYTKPRRVGRPRKHTERDCKYNEAIICNLDHKGCAKCGWNPAVTAARKDRIREEHNYGPRDDA